MKLSLPKEVQTPTCPVIADTSVLKTIGNTPLIRIKNIGNEFKDVTIFAKAEWKNAGGSVKSRPALKMIEDGEKSGKLTKNKIILDSTSGNTGIAYALIGKVKGYKVKLVMPDFSPSSIILRAGRDLTDPPAFFHSALAKIVTSLNSLPIFFILIRGVLPIVFSTEVSAITGQVGV
jgi:hypothetical protein